MQMRLQIDTMGYPEGQGILAVEMIDENGNKIDLAIPGKVYKNGFGENIFQGEWKT